MEKGKSGRVGQYLIVSAECHVSRMTKTFPAKSRAEENEGK